MGLLGVSMAQVRNQTTVVRTADDDRITETIIFAVAEARDVRPIELETPLYEAIDGDAMTAVLSGDTPSDQANMQVEFNWAGCNVIADDTGRVVVTRGEFSR